MNGKKAASFKFNPDSVQLIDTLKESSHSLSRAEVLRKALYLLDLATQAKINGKRLIIKDAKGTQETEILIV